MWIFDLSDGSARLLKERKGHLSPPTHIRFINNSTLISGGRFALGTDSVPSTNCLTIARPRQDTQTHLIAQRLS